MNMVFDHLLFDNISVPCILTLVLAILNAILPMQTINEKIFAVKESQYERKSYEKAEVDFDTVNTKPSFFFK
jgi:hypothetical protein